MLISFADEYEMQNDEINYHSSVDRVLKTDLNYRHLYSKTNRPNVDMKETSTYITKLVLNANKRDRGPLPVTF